MFQHLTKQHVLVSAPGEPFVEGAGFKHLSLYQKVCRSELVIPVSLSVLGGMGRLSILLVEISQVMTKTVVVDDTDTTINYALVII